MSEPAYERRSVDHGSTVTLNKITWGAVFAGVAVALTVHLLVNMLGFGIGVASMAPGSGDTPSGASLSLGAAIWFIVSGIIAAFIGGYLASRLSGRPLASTGALHGVVAWAVTTLIVLFLLATAAGSLIGGVFSSVGSIVGGVGSGAGTAMQTAAPSLATVNDPLRQIEEQVKGGTGGNDPQALQSAAMSAIRAALTGDQAQAADAKNRAADALARARNIPVEQARTQIDQYAQQYQSAVQQAKQQATAAANAAASYASRGALFGFAALVLGAIAGWFGGRAGTVRPVLDSRR